MKTKPKKKLTKVERRLAVLKDAVKQIELNNYVVERGNVVTLNINPKFRDDDGALLDKPAKEILQEVLKGKGATACNVCARGAMLVSLVHKENDFVLSGFGRCGSSYGEDGVTDVKLAALFSETQLALMEQAFEQGKYDLEEVCEEVQVDYTSAINYNYLTEDQIQKATAFHDKYDDSTERLLAIFRNAIRNKGIFKP